MSQRFPLLFVADRATAEKFVPTSQGPRTRLPDRTRSTHGKQVQDQLTEVWNKFQQLNEERNAVGLPVRYGMYLEFHSASGFDLALQQLERVSKGIRIMNVRVEEREIRGEVEQVVIATVYVPNDERGFFLEQVRKYLEEDTAGGNPRNRKLVESIEDIGLAVLESFWRDRVAPLPGTNAEWCEIWVRQEERSEEPKEQLFAFCENFGIEYLEEEIRFPERNVYIIKANRTQLAELFLAYEFLAEIRKARQPVSFWMGEANAAQADWAKDLLDRMNISDETNTRILILDSGVNNGHQLLNGVLSDEDVHTYDPEWGVNDTDGHGTLMSGVSIFGDLHEALQHGDEVNIKHLIESGKILPPKGQNEEHLYGDITSQVISLAEIANDSANRIICLAITVDDDNRGFPSSWSGSIDALASGYEEEEVKRLIVVAAGNIMESRFWNNYPNTNISFGIHTPAQAWNALTVGAYTQKSLISDPTLAGYTAIAPAMGLSPFSSTSMSWDKAWPQKPDIVMEGGNAGTDATGFNSTVEDLDILSTSHEITQRQFDVFQATSAATAKAAHLCALIQSEYPAAWPETVRGLMVHSASWTQAMQDHFLVGNTDRKALDNLIRCCGYGVPNPEKALYCANNLLTLIAQEGIQPFMKGESGGYPTKDVHFFDLPWPTAVLQELGSVEVTMRVTLSYFIEPGPGEIGWSQRYRYPSHGLRFDVNNYSEDRDNFRQRINKAARTEGEEYDSNNNSGRWLIGTSARHRGSIHTDEITATAAQLAECKYISVYPSGGWWKERPHLKRFDSQTRYSLIVTLETEATQVDLYSEIAAQIGVPITL